MNDTMAFSDRSGHSRPPHFSSGDLAALCCWTIFMSDHHGPRCRTAGPGASLSHPWINDPYCGYPLAESMAKKTVSRSLL